MGRVSAVRQKAGCTRLTVEAGLVSLDTRIGDSISLDGVCLTVVEAGRQRLAFDIMPSTLAQTTLKTLRVGSRVNMERAMKADSRFGGHMVSGHVDGVGVIRSKKIFKGQWLVSISVKPFLLKNIFLKGSVAVDGVSLTVSEKKSGCFSVGLIPHTAAVTTLGRKASGSLVNVETDMMRKFAYAGSKEG